MPQRQEFLQQTSEIISGLETALGELADKRSTATEHLNELRTQRIDLLHEHVEDLLPDLEFETIATLRREVPTFVTRPVETIFREASEVRIPFLTRLFGNPSTHRAETMQTELDTLRTNLSAVIDGMNPMPDRFEDLQNIDREIAGIQSEIRDWAAKEKGVQEHATSLRGAHERFTKNQSLPVPQKLMSSVRGVAAGLSSSRTSSRSAGTSSTDDGTDFLIYWATGFPTSFRTLAVDAMFGHHGGSEQPAPFVSGGGEMGGGGASGDWEKNPATNATDEAVEGVGDIINLAAVGSIS